MLIARCVAFCPLRPVNTQLVPPFLCDLARTAVFRFGALRYEEFYAMAKDPDPARPGFNPENGAKPAAKTGGWDPATGAPVPGPPGGAGSKTEQEQAAQAAQAALLRQEKRELLFTFQKQTQLTLRHLQSAYHKFKAQDKSHSGVLDIKGFCKLLNVEATGEFSRLIKLYDRDGTKKIDVNEFLLGVSNFTGASAVCAFVAADPLSALAQRS